MMIKTMHLPAGLAARGIVEGTKYAINRSKKLQNLSDKIFRGRGTEAVGVGIPTLDTVLEYVPIYKDTKDSIVQSITHSPIRAPDLPDQLNDFFWFELGYFAPELYNASKQGIKQGYQTLKDRIKKKD